MTDRSAEHWYPTAAYLYVLHLDGPALAWEYLRRNFDYQASARIGHRRGVARQRLAAGPVLTRLRARHAGAERWGLGCFRRS